jgi:hypothetical protein
MPEGIGPTADIFVAFIAEHGETLVDCRLDGFAIVSRRYRDKTGIALYALYRRGYE